MVQIGLRFMVQIGLRFMVQIGLRFMVQIGLRFMVQDVYGFGGYDPLNTFAEVLTSALWFMVLSSERATACHEPG